MITSDTSNLDRAIADYNGHRDGCPNCSAYHFDATFTRCYYGILLVEGIEREASRIGRARY